jgi:SMC interacting uncharacterized protein involved in chromosome segregation
MAVFSVMSSERKNGVEQINEIIDECVEAIKTIDDALTDLVQAGLKGSAINTLAASYESNREEISKYIKVFAGYSIELSEQEAALERLNEEANDAATIK